VQLPKNGDGEYAATRGLTLPAAFVLLNTGKIQEAGCIDTPIKCILWLAVATRFKPFSIDIPTLVENRGGHYRIRWPPGWCR